MNGGRFKGLWDNGGCIDLALSSREAGDETRVPSVITSTAHGQTVTLAFLQQPAEQPCSPLTAGRGIGSPVHDSELLKHGADKGHCISAALRDP
ncbi:hypothetical protein DV961_14300 [Staphylococcus pseudintermedius]|uniref:Uncharacterized protein n=1 Tax=Staphylococcus pseudintermedius TaxID=283734 RepID=A0A3D8YIU6_STAPS|nr:hypothetical protein DV961_14300 [Staphylococcus pseudintermedius]